MDVTRDLCDRMRAQAGTKHHGAHQHQLLRAFLHWGEQHGYFTPLQAELLPHACSMPAPAIRRSLYGPTRPPRHDRARMNGQAGDLTSPRRTLRHANGSSPWRAELKKRFPNWGALAPELAASSGPRWGEQFRLTAYDVHLEGCAEYRGPPHSRRLAGRRRGRARRRRVRPKGDKTRVIPVSTLSITGFRLRDALSASERRRR